MNVNDKNIREALIYCIEHSKHKHNNELKQYVLNEMSKEEILVAFWLQRIITEDSQQGFRIPEILQVPFHILAGGALTGALSKSLQKIFRKKSFAQRGAEALAPAMIGTGVTLLAHALYIIYKRAIDQCTRKCKTIVRSGKNTPYQFRVCFYQCKVESIKRIIMKIRQERSMCSQSKYPEKCIETMNTQIVKYQTELEKELYRLKKSRAALAARLRKIPISMSSKPSTEKL